MKAKEMITSTMKAMPDQLSDKGMPYARKSF
jgi:hypothetical protein